MANPVEMKIGNTTFELELLGLDGECQQHVYWCWAAVAVGVANYYQRAQGWTQCRLVQQVIGDCCTEPATPCPSSLPDAGDCDRAFPTGCGLCATGCSKAPHGFQDLSFQEVRQEIARDQPVACRIENNHAVTIYGCAWAKENEDDSYVIYWDPYDPSPRTATYRGLDTSCFWLTTPPGVANRRPATQQEIEAFAGWISQVRPDQQPGSSLDLFRLKASAVSAGQRPETPTARRYVLEGGTVWRDVPLGAEGKELFARSSLVSAPTLPGLLAERRGQSPEIEERREAEVAIVEIPTVCTRALWRRRSDEFVPVGRIPYFLGDGAPLFASAFWNSVRKHVQIAVNQEADLDFPCGGQGGCDECPNMKKKRGLRNAALK
jgi:hypothetical protein